MARFAADMDLQPILAARNAVAVKAVADRYGLEHRSFGLDDAAALDRGLDGISVVVHCAGPFSHTYASMAAACLRTGTHYMDITGEIAVYAALSKLGAEAKEKGVMLLPGIGFDVVPTDCVAAHLKRRLPSATHLTLAFASVGPAPISTGTGKTFVEGLSHPGYIRKDGRMTPVPHLSKTRSIDFGKGPVNVPRMTWGDIFTAFHSTGIPNIENYFFAPSAVRSLLKMSRYIRPVMGWAPVQRALKKKIENAPPGATDEQRKASRTVIWGEVRDDEGNTAVSRLNGPDGYTFTARAALKAVERVLAGDAPTGYQTPSSAFGPDFVLEIEGISREDVTR